MKALRVAMTGVLLTALVTVGVIYWAGQDTTAAPGDPTGPSDPRLGEMFIYGEILGIDLANRVLTIEQHLDDARTEEVGDTVTMAPGVEVFASTDAGEIQSSFDALKVGHVVGMIMKDDGTIRTIIYDEMVPGTVGPIVPADPRIGEAFIEGEILAFNRADLTLTIDQHFADSQTVDVGGLVELLPDVSIRLQNDDGEDVVDLEYLAAGQIVGMILDADGKVRAIIVDNVTRGVYQPVQDQEIAPADPLEGEMFVHGEVMGLNLETRVMIIEQHLEDARTVDVDGQVTIGDNAIIRGLVDGHPVTPMTLDQLKAGDIVGMILDADGLVRAILVD